MKTKTQSLLGFHVRPPWLVHVGQRLRQGASEDPGLGLGIGGISPHLGEKHARCLFQFRGNNIPNKMNTWIYQNQCRCCTVMVNFGWLSYIPPFAKDSSAFDLIFLKVCKISRPMEKTKIWTSGTSSFLSFKAYLCNFEFRIFLRMQYGQRRGDMNPISHAISTLNSHRWSVISLTVPNLRWQNAVQSLYFSKYSICWRTTPFEKPWNLGQKNAQNEPFPKRLVVVHCLIRPQLHFGLASRAPWRLQAHWHLWLSWLSKVTSWGSLPYQSFPKKT